MSRNSPRVVQYRCSEWYLGRWDGCESARTSPSGRESCRLDWGCGAASWWGRSWWFQAPFASLPPEFQDLPPFFNDTTHGSHAVQKYKSFLIIKFNLPSLQHRSCFPRSSARCCRGQLADESFQPNDYVSSTTARTSWKTVFDLQQTWTTAFH